MGVDVRVLVSVYHKPGFIPCPGLLKPVPSEKMGGGGIEHRFQNLKRLPVQITVQKCVRIILWCTCISVPAC